MPTHPQHPPLLPAPIVAFLSRVGQGELRRRDCNEEERNAAEFCKTSAPPLVLAGIDTSAVADQTNGPIGPLAYFITDAGRQALVWNRFADRICGNPSDFIVRPEPAAKPKKRGRPSKLTTEDRKRDARIVEAWDSGQYKTYVECATALGDGCTAADVRRALDRQRKAPE